MPMAMAPDLPPCQPFARAYCIASDGVRRPGRSPGRADVVDAAKRVRLFCGDMVLSAETKV